MTKRSSFRAPAAAAAAALLALVGVACGDDSSGSDSEGVTIEHRYGTTALPDDPERVVTVGLSDHDAVLALGVAPVAVTYWYEDYDHATWPWAQDELEALDAEPVVLNEGEFTGTPELNFEQIASLEPDLIIGLYTAMSEREYETLSDIAPTIAPSADHPDWGTPWQEVTRTVGRALGREAEADALVAEVEAGFAAARAEHPEFEGVEAVVAEVFEEGESFVRAPHDPRTRFLTDLGFVLPDDLAALAGDQDGADVSDEQMSLLDRDLLVWNVGWNPELRGQIEANPLYQQLAAAREGRVLFIDDPVVSGALTWSTVLSLPYALDQLTPQLAATVP